MKKIGIIISVFALAVLFGTATLASAQENGRNVNQRLHRQHRRIRSGIRSGSLTRSEAHRLERRDRGIRRSERRDRRSGGGISTRERRHLDRRLNRTNRAIYRQKHDRQRRRP
jgi:hypothetical protein